MKYATAVILLFMPLFPNETLFLATIKQGSFDHWKYGPESKKNYWKGRHLKTKKHEKRILYDWTAKQLNESSKQHLLSLKKSKKCIFAGRSVCLFHGSPENPNEFLFPDTPKERFVELANHCSCDIILCGHSHTPLHLQVGNTHFINPGSVGRMFDSNPEASCAVLTLDDNTVDVDFFRIQWPIQQTILALKSHNLPEIYQTMYKLGRKLN